MKPMELCDGQCDDYDLCEQYGSCMKMNEKEDAGQIWKECNGKCLKMNKKCNGECDHHQCEIDGKC